MEQKKSSVEVEGSPKKWAVAVRGIQIYNAQITVEASTPEEARSKALELCEGGSVYWDSPGECLYETEEVEEAEEAEEVEEAEEGGQK
ncbi:MAG: hypothetical protein KF678_03465 [Phycisphaeraceae bacterium]|nr:hypothetical protein [Phycisphaeraceae bacterium]